MVKKIGRPAYENASTRTFKLNDGEYEVVKSLVDCLRRYYSYDDLNNNSLLALQLARDVRFAVFNFNNVLK